MGRGSISRTKASGIEWIGHIPEHWELKRLKFLVSFAYGDGLSAEVRVDGDIPVHGSNGVVGSHDQANTLGPAIIIGRKGSHGKINLSEGPAFAIDTTFYIDRRLTNVDIRWLAHLLGCLGLDDVSKDSAVPGLAREDAYAKHCPVPPVSEQVQVAAYIDRETARIDGLIEKKRRLLELLEEKRLAVITHAVTKGLDPSAPMKDSGIDWLGQIPAHWEVKRAKYTTSFITSGSRGWAEYYSDEGPLFLQSGNLGTRMELAFSFEQRVSPPAGAEGRRTTVNEGDVLVCITGARTGAVAHVSVDLGEAYINQHVALLRPIVSLMYPRFLAYSLWSNIGREQLWLSSYGMKEGLGLQHVLAVQTASPPLSEQEAIVDHLDRELIKADRVIEKISEAIEKLLEYRSALITNAVTGKIKVV